MKLPISQEKGPIGRKCEHWASFLGTRNRLSHARENPFPGGYGVSLLVTTRETTRESDWHSHYSRISAWGGGRRAASLRVSYARTTQLALPTPGLSFYFLARELSFVQCELGTALWFWQHFGTCPNPPTRNARRASNEKDYSFYFPAVEIEASRELWRAAVSQRKACHERAYHSR